MLQEYRSLSIPLWHKICRAGLRSTAAMRARYPSARPEAKRIPSREALLHELVRHREAAGDTQQQVATRLGKSQSYVSKIESGQRRLDLVEYVLWARAIGIDPLRPFKKLCEASDLRKVVRPRRRARSASGGP